MSMRAGQPVGQLVAQQLLDRHVGMKSRIGDVPVAQDPGELQRLDLADDGARRCPAR